MSKTTPGFDDYDFSTGGFVPSESVVSGVNLNNDYPLVEGQLDFEQEKRLQARQESEFVRGTRAERPAFTKKGPDATLAEAQATP